MPKGVASEQGTLRLRLICLRPPVAEGTAFGIQDRDRAIFSGQEQADGSISFDVQVTFRRRDSGDGVRFAGPFIHGTATAPFLYLSLKCLAPNPEMWVKRLKIPLPGLTWMQVSEAAERGVLTGRASGAGSGTVRLEGDGWEIQVPCHRPLSYLTLGCAIRAADCAACRYGPQAESRPFHSPGVSAMIAAV